MKASSLDPRFGLSTRDEDLPAAKRNEMIADYQRIVDDAASGTAKIAPGMVKFAQGRLTELRRASNNKEG